MQAALDKRGVHRAIETIRDQMDIMGIRWRRKKRPKGTTKVSKKKKKEQNLIKQDFTAQAPLEKVLTDVTVIECATGKLYLAAALDCYNGEILAIEIRDNMKKELCISLVEQLENSYGCRALKGCIIHSDRGAQYTSEEYCETLVKAGIIQSLCGIDHCYDNARMESFFATLKKELIYQKPTYRMAPEEVITMIYRYIFVYYNRVRLTSVNPDWLPPSIYREMKEAEQKDKAKVKDESKDHKAA